MADTQTIPDVAGKLRRAWPILTDDQRQLILDLVWVTAGPDSAWFPLIEDLEDELALAASESELAFARPFDEVIAEIEAQRVGDRRDIYRGR